MKKEMIEMDSKLLFALAWIIMFVAVLVAMTIVLGVAMIFGAPGTIWLSLILLPFVFIVLAWNSKIEVPPNWEYIYEWRGKIMEPFTPGWYYSFPYFGLLSEGIEVPKNKHMLYILTGERTGLPIEIVNQYVYGTPSNIEPGSGDLLRLLSKIEFEVEDSIKLAYNQNDPYAYIVGIVELEVNLWIHDNSSEHIIDNFSKENWDLKVLSKIRSKIIDELGVNLISYTPIDVINTPEVEAFRRNTELEKRQKEVLKAQLENMDVKKEIAEKADQIKVHSFNSVKQAANVDGEAVLRFLNQEKTLNTVLEASKNGNITYMDASGSGNLVGSSAMGWGFHAHNQTAPSPKKDDDDDNNKKSKK